MRRRRTILIILAVLWMGVIFYFSSQTGDLSRAASGRAVRFLEKLFFPGWAALPEEQHALQTFALTFLVRKTAHFTEYVILGALLSGVLLTFRKTWLFRVLLAAAAGILYAVTDEIHQMFVAGRSMMVFDMLTDAAGVVTGVLFTLGIAAMLLSSGKVVDRAG